jgi:hypothetical protein
MSKTTLYQKITKEIEKINDRIDTKIVKGVSYEEEARRHRTLLVTLQRISEESQPKVQALNRRSCFGKSPVRHTLKRSVISRLFERKFAY